MLKSGCPQVWKPLVPAPTSSPSRPSRSCFVEEAQRASGRACGPPDSSPENRLRNKTFRSKLLSSKAGRKTSKSLDRGEYEPQDSGDLAAVTNGKVLHPLNVAVIRGMDGYWGSDSLPVTDWEAPEQRVVIPENLHESLNLRVQPVLRWDVEKYAIVIKQHSRDVPMHILGDLSGYLAKWRYHGTEIARPQNQRILFQDEDGRWYAASIGPLLGSDNFISITGSSRDRFLRNRLSGIKNVKGNGT